MRARTRILEAAMHVFRRHRFRRSSIEQAAEAAGLTRQALYHHFKSKEALFRAVIEQLDENALAAEIAAANAEEKAGGSLADILVAEVTGRLGQIIASFDGSPHIEELPNNSFKPATSIRNMPPSMASSWWRPPNGSAASNSRFLHRI
jgi:TetR/AcrR family acrAB operon transcriptional repressor